MVDFITCLSIYLEECKSIIKRFVAIYSRLTLYIQSLSLSNCLFPFDDSLSSRYLSTPTPPFSPRAFSLAFAYCDIFSAARPVRQSTYAPVDEEEMMEEEKEEMEEEVTVSRAYARRPFFRDFSQRLIDL